MTDGLPDELRELIAAERSAPVGASRAAVRAKLAASVGAAPLGAAAAGAGAAGASALGAGAKLLAVLALVVGAGTVAVVKRGSGAGEQPAAPRAAMAAVVPAPATAAAAAPLKPLAVSPQPLAAAAPLKPLAVSPQPLAVSPQPLAAAVPPPQPQPQPPPPPQQPQPALSQADLLRRAWAASPSNPTSALALVAQDAELHPDGPLSEERDALRIHLLTQLHRLDEARIAAAAFITSHPNSVHRPMIERATQPAPEPSR